MNNYMEARNDKDEVVDRLNSCRKLVKMYPGFCASEGGDGGRCCESCKGWLCDIYYNKNEISVYKPHISGYVNTI